LFPLTSMPPIILPVAVVVGVVVVLASARSSFVRRCRLDAIVPSREIDTNANIVSSEQRITFIGLDVNALLWFQEGRYGSYVVGGRGVKRSD
jgi:hypothetical protein